jgi:hypothetical protein
VSLGACFSRELLRACSCRRGLALAAIAPSFRGLYLMAGAGRCVCQGAWPCFAGRVDHLRPVAGSPRAGASVCQGRGRPVCKGQTFEQVFDQGASNKCSKQVFDSVSGSVCQNFEPNLGNFQPNPKLFQPNPDRIFTYFSTESWIGLLPRLALQDR